MQPEKIPQYTLSQWQEFRRSSPTDRRPDSNLVFNRMLGIANANIKGYFYGSREAYGDLAKACDWESDELGKKTFSEVAYKIGVMYGDDDLSAASPSRICRSAAKEAMLAFLLPLTLVGRCAATGEVVGPPIVEKFGTSKRKPSAVPGPIRLSDVQGSVSGGCGNYFTSNFAARNWQAPVMRICRLFPFKDRAYYQAVSRIFECAGVANEPLHREIGAMDEGFAVSRGCPEILLYRLVEFCRSGQEPEGAASLRTLIKSMQPFSESNVIHIVSADDDLEVPIDLEWPDCKRSLEGRGSVTVDVVELEDPEPEFFKVPDESDDYVAPNSVDLAWDVIYTLYVKPYAVIYGSQRTSDSLLKMLREPKRKNSPAVNAVRAIGILNQLAKLSEKPFLPYQRALREDIMADEQIVFDVDDVEVKLYTAYPVLSYCDGYEASYFDTEFGIFSDVSANISFDAYITRIVDGECYGRIEVTLHGETSPETLAVIQDGVWVYPMKRES